SSSSHSSVSSEAFDSGGLLDCIEVLRNLIDFDLAADFDSRSRRVRTYSSFRFSFLRHCAYIFSIVVSTKFHLLSANKGAILLKYIAAAPKSPSSLQHVSLRSSHFHHT